MADCRNTMSDRGRENYGLDVNRILDSCRDKDCYADTRVYLTDCDQDIIERSTSIRVKDACITGADIDVEPVQFNRGFYSVLIRFYIRITAEAGMCPGRPQEIEGVAVVDKKVILYGGEGNVSIFRSGIGSSNNCPSEGGIRPSTKEPVAVCEVAAPVVLDSRIEEKCARPRCTCCCVEDIPDGMSRSLGSMLTDAENGGKVLLVSLGLFSVVRIERPCQCIVSASEYSVPDKECCPNEDSDPCSVFKCMAFPVGEFSSSPCRG